MQKQKDANHFVLGAIDGMPFLLVVGPFALLFGVVANEAGLNIAETLAFSVVVIAGAAQFTALQLLADQAPAMIALLSALAVNLRMAMYSASLTPWLGEAPLWQRACVAYLTLDQTFAVSHNKYEEMGPSWTTPQRLRYFMGVALAVVPIWFILSAAGAVIGQGLPEWLPLDFAVPITFLAIVGPALRTRAHVMAAFSAASTALALAFLPYNLGLFAAMIVGLVMGAEVERRNQKAAP